MFMLSKRVDFYAFYDPLLYSEKLLYRFFKRRTIYFSNKTKESNLQTFENNSKIQFFEYNIRTQLKSTNLKKDNRQQFSNPIVAPQRVKRSCDILPI